MNETQSNISAQKTARSAMQRVEQLEAIVPQIVRQVNTQQTQLGTLSEILDSVVEILGKDVVTETITKNRRARAKEQSAAEIKQVQDLVAQGRLKPGLAAGPKTFLVFRETDKDGKPLDPDRTQLVFDNLVEQFKGELLGKEVGAKITSPSGNQFEVTEIYEIVETVPADAAAPEAAATETKGS